MGSTDRRARERQAVQDKILAAARELFARYGTEAVTLRKVAEAIEYTPAAIYGHFPSKEELIRQLCLRDFGVLAEQFVELARIPDPIQRIAAAGRAHVRFAVEHPNHFKVMFMQSSWVEPSAEQFERIDDPQRDAYAFVRHAVDEALFLGRFRKGYEDGDLITQTLWAGVHGVAALEISFRGLPLIDLRSAELRADAMIDALIHGLCRPAEPARSRSSSKRGRR